MVKNRTIYFFKFWKMIILNIYNLTAIVIYRHCANCTNPAYVTKYNGNNMNTHRPQLLYNIITSGYKELPPLVLTMMPNMVSE